MVLIWMSLLEVAVRREEERQRETGSFLLTTLTLRLPCFYLHPPPKKKGAISKHLRKLQASKGAYFLTVSKLHSASLPGCISETKLVHVMETASEFLGRLAHQPGVVDKRCIPGQVEECF